MYKQINEKTVKKIKWNKKRSQGLRTMALCQGVLLLA